MKRTREEFRREREALFGRYPDDSTELKQFYADWFLELDVGDHAHVCLWSDVYPVTVIKRTPSTLTVRRAKAIKRPGAEPYSQDWLITDDPNGEIEVFRWSKTNLEWRMKQRIPLYPEWQKYYDYSF